MPLAFTQEDFLVTNIFTTEFSAFSDNIKGELNFEI